MLWYVEDVLSMSLAAAGDDLQGHHGQSWGAPQHEGVRSLFRKALRSRPLGAQAGAQEALATPTRALGPGKT